MKRILFPCLFLLLASCQKEPLLPGTPRLLRMPDRFNRLAHSHVRQDSTREEAAGTPAVWITAMEFPSWADWRGGDLRGAEVVLYKDGVPVRRVPAGDNPDPERHRVRNGRLWTDRIEGRETVLLRDGEMLLRWEGEEVLMGFWEEKGHVYTLGQRPGGQGFSFRMDGKEVFSDPSGVITGSLNDREWSGGALTRDTLGLCYTYGIPIQGGGKTEWEYRVMSRDSCLKVIPKGTSNLIYDIRVWKGSIWRADRRTESPATLCLVRDNSYHSLGLSGSATPSLIKLAPCQDDMAVKASECQANKRWTFWYRIRDRLAVLLNDNCEMADVWLEGTDYASISQHNGRVYQVRHGNERLLTTPASSDYRLSSPLCAALHEGVFHVALSSAEGDQHLVLSDEGAVSLTFHGYFTALRIE